VLRAYKVITAGLILSLTVLHPVSASEIDDATAGTTGDAADTSWRKPNITGAYYADRPLDTAAETLIPTEALFRSLFVPGWGQLSNGKYIKAGVVIALETVLIGTVVHYAEKTSDTKDKFTYASNEIEKARFFSEFKSAKSQRNRFSWFLGTLVFLSMFDAYVDAHLAQFPKFEEKLSLDLVPREDGLLEISLTCRF
jgi:hypothetical protein